MNFGIKTKESKHVQGVPTCLGQAKCNILKLRSLPAKITNFPKKRILLHKIAFSVFFVNCKIKMELFLQLSYVVIHLANCLKLEKSCFKIPFSILQLTKKAEKAILWSRIRFFGKFVIFAGKLLSFKMLHLANPKHVGTPCIKLLSHYHSVFLFKKYF